MSIPQEAQMSIHREAHGEAKNSIHREAHGEAKNSIHREAHVVEAACGCAGEPV